MTTIHQGDCLTVLPSLPAGSVNCCVTSPPYYGLRDYGVDGQIGLEPTPEAYVARLVEVFREVWRVLKDDGTLWLNLGDSYASGKGTCYNPGGGKDSLGKSRKDAGAHPLDRGNISELKAQGLKPKDLIGIPWRVAFALQADGWYLRQDIIWSKPNPMPESVKDRCTKSHEYIFLLSKSRKYYFDQNAVKEPVAEATIERLSQANLFNQKGSDRVPGKTNGPMKAVGPVAGWREPVAESTIGRGPVDFGGKKGREYTPKKGDPNYRNGKEQWGRTFDYRESCKAGRNRRSVWTVSTKPFKGAGTTGIVCLAHTRDYIGIELNEEYVEMTRKRLPRATRP